MKQEYRINAKLRRRGQTALDHNRTEFKSEDFEDDEEYCLAIASELLEMIREDREYLEGTDESTYEGN